MVALEIESWTWWSLVMFVALNRFISRRMVLGSFRKFQADDYTMIVILGFYTTLIVAINIVRHTNSNLLPPGYNISTITPADRQEREYGSKLILVVEQCQCVTIWGAKLCLIALYLRLTTMRKENIAIKVLLGYVIGSFIIMDILYFGVWCQPFHNYWAVPTPNPQCSAATHHLITNATFNLSSDIALMAIGLPMFLRLKLPLRKKLPIIAIFSLGFFTIVAAILNKYYSFTHPFGAQWTYWYVRESSTSLLVANLPFVWTTWRRITGFDKTVLGQSKAETYSPEAEASSQEIANLAAPPPAARLKTAEEWLAEDSDAEDEKALALQRKRTGQLSLSDMLAEPNYAGLSSEHEPNPITHPAMFYSKSKRGKKHVPSSEIPLTEVDVACNDFADRRSFGPEPSSPSDQRTMASSSTFPSVRNKTSTGSFV